MINEGIVKRLKQTNVSKDSEKTKTRVNELWKSASKSQKNAVEKMAGISRATIYRVYNTGSISAKLVIPMAKNFNVNPQYLTGETNETGECTDEILVEYLTELGYGHIIGPEIDKEKRRQAREKGKQARVELQKDEEPELQSPAPAAVVNAADLTLADLHLLMQSLLLREKAGIENAVEKAAKLRALLLS